MQRKEIDWVRILSEHGISFKLEGTNVARGNVQVCCPFCDYDEKYFLGIKLGTTLYSCWWSHDHSGGNPVTLLQALLRVSYIEAQRILSEYTGVDLQDFAELSSDTFSVSFDTVEEEIHTTFLDTFSQISTSNRKYRRYVYYLRNRGFRLSDIEELSSFYKLQACSEGMWTNRIIIPIYDQEGLATWTARDIGNSDLRYMSLSCNKESKMFETTKTLARENVKHVLLNQESLYSETGKVLVVTEGPLDGLKLDMYGRRLNVRCTCLFGKTMSPEQAVHITNLSRNYDRIIFILDTGTGLDDISLCLQIPGTERMLVPYGAEDLGALDWKQAKRFSRRVLNESTSKIK